MNDKIKELAEQAGVEFDDDLSLEREPIYYVNQSELTKFAELIIRECLSYTKDDGDLDFMKFMIKKNFGVDP